MDPITSSSLIVLQLSAGVLHIYIAYCFYPDRDTHKRHRSFIYIMLLCGLFHFSDAVFEMFHLSGLSRAAGYAYLFHIAVEYALCPFMVSNLLAEYIVLPKKPSTVALILRKLLLQAPLLARGVAILALLSFSNRVYRLLSAGELPSYYNYEMHAGSLVMVLGVLWVIVVLCGLRPEEDAQGHSREPVLWMRGFLVGITIVAIALDSLGEHLLGAVSRTSLVHFVTVPFALIYGWYRYRFELIDVVIRWAIALFAIQVVVVTGYLQLPLLEPALQPLAVYFLAMGGYFLARVSGKLLLGLWMPAQSTVKRFRATFSMQLAQCDTPQQALDLTEEKLGRLFQCSVKVNRPPGEDVARSLELGDEPPIAMHLGYIRGLRPWFSQGLAVANEAALHLQSTLQVMAWREIQHRTQLNNQSLQTLAARAERDAMRAQIRPHFFFNVLNTMHTYVKEDPDQAQRVIELMAELMRAMAKTTDQDTYPLSQELSLAHTYLQIEQVRFGDRFTFELDIDKTLLEYPVPPFSIQPLVENAVKYSVDSQLEPARIVVSVKRLDDSVQITVADNGRGLSAHGKSDGLGMALSNIRDRLEKLYGAQGNLDLTPASHSGTLATLRIPWHGANEGISG